MRLLHSCETRVTENRVTEIGSHQKKFGPSSSLVSSQWSHKSRYSQHTHAKFRDIQTTITYSSIAL